MKVTRKGVKTIQDLLTKREPSLPDTPASREFLNNVSDAGNLGVVRGKRIILTSEDVRVLAQAYTKVLGQPVYSFKLDASDYLEAAKQTPQEKIASASGPFAGLMHMAGTYPEGIPFVDGVNPVTPPGTFLFAEPAQLDMTRIGHVLIVENGTLFRHWERMVHIMPDPERTLILYRGHDQAAKLVLELLKKENGRCMFTVFFDLDGAGLEKAEQFACAGAQQVILPSLDAVLHNGMSKAEEFAKQRHQLFGVIERNRYRCLTRSGNQLKDGEFAITQETLIAQNVPLSAYQL